MKNIFLVGAGGGIGSIGRYLLGALVARHCVGQEFPFGTLAVNLLGCGIGGALTEWMAAHGTFSADVRLLLFAGLLGGFTTFSAFSLETVALWRRGAAGMAAAYVLLSVGGGLLAFWGGMKTVSLTLR